MDPLEEEIGRFWAKSPAEIEATLEEAGLDPTPAVEAILELLHKQESNSPLK